jgi:hypothetical protein
MTVFCPDDPQGPFEDVGSTGGGSGLRSVLIELAIDEPFAF